MRLTREEALKRALEIWGGGRCPYIYHDFGSPLVADLLLSVQAETAEKCCEIAKLHDESTATGGECAVDISIAIRAAFPGDEAK